MTRYSTLYRVMALLLEHATNDTLLYTVQSDGTTAGACY